MIRSEIKTVLSDRMTSIILLSLFDYIESFSQLRMLTYNMNIMRHMHEEQMPVKSRILPWILGTKIDHQHSMITMSAKFYIKQEESNAEKETNI